MERKQLKLYAVTDRRWLSDEADLYKVTEEMLRGGATCVQLREKDLPDEAILEEARKLKKICQRYGAPLIINDRPDLALRAGADGVHLGQSDMEIRRARELLGPDALIGGTAHNLQEALRAEAVGADYLGCGAVFGTDTKQDTTPLSIEELTKICRAVHIPVVAIGGIDEARLKVLNGSGIAGVAVIHALYGAKDPYNAAKRLCAKLDAFTVPVLSIAGSDSSGGAGIQADLKTMSALGVYGMTAITSLTAQNTLGVRAVLEVPPAFLNAQLAAVFEDIPPAAVKLGMIPSAQLMETAAEQLSRYDARHVVLDPVMIATSGARLMQADALSVMRQRLFPLAELLTPNLPEAEALTGQPISGRADMERAAKELSEEAGCAVLIKGGHLAETADDLLLDAKHGIRQWFSGKRIPTENTHGTGCTLSSAIACGLGRGDTLPEAVAGAKNYLTGLLEAGLSLGHGNGPLWHNAPVLRL